MKWVQVMERVWWDYGRKVANFETTVRLEAAWKFEIFLDLYRVVSSKCPQTVHVLILTFILCLIFCNYNISCWCSPKTFNVNTTQLAERYKELQWKLHPDKFSELSKVFLKRPFWKIKILGSFMISVMKQRNPRYESVMSAFYSPESKSQVGFF